MEQLHEGHLLTTMGGRASTVVSRSIVGGYGDGDGAAPRGGKDDRVKTERLRKGRRHRTMGGGVGGHRVWRRRAGGRRRWRRIGIV